MLGAALWGLFWIPLRYLDSAGVHGLWAIALVLCLAAVPALVLSYYNNEIAELTRIEAWLVGIALGTSIVLYFTAILYSDVVRVIFLFYLLPVWTSLSARVVYGEPISAIKSIAIATALVGVWLLLGGGRELPYPKNVGDWAAIASGMCWGISLSLIRGRQHAPPFASTAIALSAGCLFSVLCASVLFYLQSDLGSALPSWNSVENVLLAGMLFSMLAIFPALLSQIWGARRIPAPTAALLTMTEILVATLSASVLIGTELNPIAWAGGMIIVISVCIDLYAQLRTIRIFVR